MKVKVVLVAGVFFLLLLSSFLVCVFELVGLDNCSIVGLLLQMLIFFPFISLPFFSYLCHGIIPRSPHMSFFPLFTLLISLGCSMPM